MRTPPLFVLAATAFFSQPAHARPDDGRRAVLTDFSAIQAAPRPSIPRSRPDDAMIAEFSALAHPNDLGPSWTPILIAKRDNVADCSWRPYRSSSLLKPQAEERRRLFYPEVVEAACSEAIPVGLIDALLIQESGYNPLAVSSKGAFGLGQLMAGTARSLAVDRFDVRANLRGTARYLQLLLAQFGQVPLALAAYNAGPRRVQNAGGLPPIRETMAYVKRVLLNWSILEAQAAHSDNDGR